MIDSTQPAARFFWGVTARPKLVLTVSLALIVVAASFVPGLTKDTTADAFIAADNPAVVYRDKAKQIFGLEDPIVVAVVRDAEGGIYHPDALNVLRTLTEHIEQLDNIDPERVTSLWTESDIRGTADGMEVTKFYELGDHPADGDAIRAAIQNFPLYEGNLVARNPGGGRTHRPGSGTGHVRCVSRTRRQPGCTGRRQPSCGGRRCDLRLPGHLHRPRRAPPQSHGGGGDYDCAGVFAAKHRRDDRQRFVELRQPLPHRTELEAQARVFRFEPSGANAEGGAPM